jgi:hypothetical protein
MEFADENEPVRRSIFEWLFEGIGLPYSLLLPVTALVAFVLVIILLRRAKGVELVGALLFVVPMPIFVGCIRIVYDMIEAMQVVAISDSPKLGEVVYAATIGMATFWYGMILVLPSYLLALGGLFARAIRSARSQPPLSNSASPAKLV